MMLLFGALAIFLFITLKFARKLVSGKLRTVLIVLAIAFTIIPIAGLEILFYLPKESIIVSRESIPIHKDQNFTLINNNDIYAFGDGYGNCFIIPKEQADIKIFPDEELPFISVSKVETKEYISDSVNFWLDFGICKREPNFKEKFEICIPESSFKTSTGNSFNISELSVEQEE